MDLVHFLRFVAMMNSVAFAPLPTMGLSARFVTDMSALHELGLLQLEPRCHAISAGFDRTTVIRGILP
jgi:hypothetical protein